MSDATVEHSPTDDEGRKYASNMQYITKVDGREVYRGPEWQAKRTAERHNKQAHPFWR